MPRKRTRTAMWILVAIVATAVAIPVIVHNSRDDDDSNPLVGIGMLILAPIAAMLIQFAISRQREFKADAGINSGIQFRSAPPDGKERRR